ncbi:hypothetical protein Hanom_Chr06g00536331 [Helianthus anomalus]
MHYIFIYYLTTITSESCTILVKVQKETCFHQKDHIVWEASVQHSSPFSMLGTQPPKTFDQTYPFSHHLACCHSVKTLVTQYPSPHALLKTHCCLLASLP